MTITRENVDDLLDAGRIQVAMANGAWRSIRRNGKTKRWKRIPDRLEIPFKHGLYGYGIMYDYQLGSMYNLYRIKPDGE